MSFKTDITVNDGEGFIRYNPPIVIYDPNEPLSTETSNSCQADNKVESPALDRKNRSEFKTEADKKRYTEGVLNQIFPPREWEKNGKRYRQTISSVPGTREDVIVLREQIVESLKRTRAKKKGICPVRSNIMDQCFLEMVRQETVDCGERGLMMKGIHDQVENRLNVYRQLVEANVAYGRQKALQGEEASLEMQAQISELEKQLEELHAKLCDLEDLADQRRSRARELREADVRKREEEINTLKRNLGVLESYMSKLTIKEAQGKK